MKKYLLLVLLLLPAAVLNAQTYEQQILQYRAQYRRELVSDSRSPLSPDDTVYLRFYAPNEQYRVTAHFKRTPDAKAFAMATHTGKTKQYRTYGIVSFQLHGERYTLHIYQGLELMKKPGLADYLFIPFNDGTNNETTYGGGRYLDIRIGDIKHGKLVLDFNKAYNPYCAFGGGFSCPIPPDENKLAQKIEAGEMNFGKNVE